MESDDAETCHAECLMPLMTAIGDLHPIPADLPRQRHEVRVEKPRGVLRAINRLAAAIAASRFGTLLRRKVV